jgi:hypothetical protein
MSSPTRLAFTGSIFALPLAIVGAGLTFVGWVMQKLAADRPNVVS